MKYTVVKEDTITYIVVVEADNPNEAYDKAQDEYFGSPGSKPTEKVDVDHQWLWTDVYEGEDAEERDDDSSVLHVDNL